MKITYIFLFFSLFAINFSNAMEGRKMPNPSEIEKFNNLLLQVTNKEVEPNLLNHFEKKIYEAKDLESKDFYSYLNLKLLTLYPEYEEIILNLICFHVTGKKYKTFFVKLYSLFPDIFTNKFSICDALRDENATKFHIAVHLNAQSWLEKNLKNYSFNNSYWSYRNAEHYCPEIDQRNKQGYTALALAIIQKNFDMVKMLLPYSNIMNAGNMQDFAEDLKLKTKEEAITILQTYFNTSIEIAEHIYNHLERVKINHLPPEMIAKIMDHLLDDAKNGATSNDLLVEMASNIATQNSPPGTIISQLLALLQTAQEDTQPGAKYADATRNLLHWNNYQISKQDNNKPEVVNVIADEDLIIDRIYLRMKKSDPKITKLHVAIYLKNILWIKKNIKNINSYDILTADAQSMVPLILAIDKGNKQLFDMFIEKLKEEPTGLSFAQVLVSALNKPNRVYYIESLINNNLISTSDILAKDNHTKENALILAVRKSVQAQNTIHYMKLFASLMQILNNQLSSVELQELLQMSLHVDAPRAVEYLLNHNMVSGHDILAKNANGDSITLSIQKDRLILFKRFLEILLSNNFTIDYNSILMGAVHDNASNITEYLLDQKLIKNVDVKDSNGNTPLIIAANNLDKCHGRNEQARYIIKLLRQRGANSEIINNDGSSAVSLASEYEPDLLSKSNTVNQNSIAIDKILKYLGLRK